MKIAILGKLKQTTTYSDWSTSFRRQFFGKSISKILITGSNTVLNMYVKRFANSLSIPIKEYHINESPDYLQAKLTRNKVIISDADLVVACVDERICVDNVDNATTQCCKKVIILYIHQ